MSYSMTSKVVVVGTSHISRQSITTVKKTIADYEPDIVAVELDHRRFHAIMDGKRQSNNLGAVRQLGLNGFLFMILGGFIQRKLGKYVGVAPGSEMKAGIVAARKHGAKVALIDRDIVKTMQRFSKKLTWKERWRFLLDIFQGLVGRGEMRELAKDFDITKVPSEKIIVKMMEIMKKRYPNAHLVLVDERNRIMAANIKRLIEQNEGSTIVAVVGAGHQAEIERLLKEKKETTTYNYSVSS